MRKGLLASFAIFLFGVFILLDTNGAITGAFIGTNDSIGNEIVGLYAILVSCFLLATASSDLEKILVKSVVKKDKALVGLAEEAANSEQVRRELDHLVKELSKGNLEAGRGRPGHLKGTGISYLRGRNGGRLYYHQIDDTVIKSEKYKTYEIVGYSGKRHNQDKVITKLLEKYS